MDIEDYNYILPKELIGINPAEPRDEARLMVYNTKTNEVVFDVFKNLSRYIPRESLLVLNNTRVLPARVFMNDGNNEKREILILVNEITNEGEVLSMVRGAVSVGDKFEIEGEVFEVVKVLEKVVTMKTSLGLNDLENFLIKHGTTPLPPYIKDHNMSEDELRDRYQTIFANRGKAAAAPTASLHFTDRVFESLLNIGVTRAFVTLDVGLGTFKPLTIENMEKGILHSEFVAIDKSESEKIRDAKKGVRSVVAVGTTVVRTLEAFDDAIMSGEQVASPTDIFIRKGFEFNMVDALITNFHVPKSSLLMLVDAYLKYKGAEIGVIELYQRAIEEKMRFFSFGDSMLIL